MKKEAQQEARQQAAKAKARRHQVSAAQVSDKATEDYVPPMLLQIGINNANKTRNALQDSGANVNVMAEHIDLQCICQATIDIHLSLN